MKKLSIGLLCFLSALSFASDIYLSVGQTINVRGTTVTCGSNHGGGHGAPSCARLRLMDKEQIFQIAKRSGIGGCFIFNNGEYYGVMDEYGQQISQTYHCPDVSYPGGYCDRPVNGLIQLACELNRCR
jgi:hypothetical protein